MDTNIKENGTKIQLSLAATMFFAPFVRHMLNKGHFSISEDDKKFVNGYVRLGFLAIGLLLVTLTALGFWYLFPVMVLRRVYLIAIGILIVLLMAGSIAVLTNTSILQGDGKIFGYQTTTANKGSLVLSFIPVYNIYLWYKLHDFEHPYRWAKESIIMRTAFVALTVFTQSLVISSLLVTIIIIRIASLLGGIDVVDEEVKKKLSKIFEKNPEEIWAYISGPIRFVLKKGKKDEKVSDFIKLEREKYGKLAKLNDRKIWIQYLIGTGILAGLYYLGNFNIYSRVYFVPIVLILGRYGLMAVKWKHLPNIPIAKEIVDCVFNIKFKRKNSK